MTNLEEAKVKYPNEWIAFRMAEEGDNPAGEVLLHEKDRIAFDQELVRQGLTEVYVTFTGPLVREGFSIMF